MTPLKPPRVSPPAPLRPYIILPHPGAVQVDDKQLHAGRLPGGRYPDWGRSTAGSSTGQVSPTVITPVQLKPVPAVTSLHVSRLVQAST